MLNNSYTEHFILSGTDLVGECYKGLNDYGDPKKYTLLSQPGTKGVQRATRLKWVLDNLNEQAKQEATELKATQPKFTAKVFVELYKFYEKEDEKDKSRLHNDIRNLLLESVGLKADMEPTEKKRIINNHMIWLDVFHGYEIEGISEEELLKKINTKLRQELNLQSLRFKYTTQELLALCREYLVGHQDANSYNFWNKPRQKGLDRETKLDLFLQKLEQNKQLTERDVFLKIYEFYKNDPDGDSRLRQDLGKTLLLMLQVNPNKTDESAWNEINAVYRRFGLKADGESLVLENITDSILEAVSTVLVNEQTSSSTENSVFKQFEQRKG